MIHRPQGRASNFKAVKIVDGDDTSGGYDFKPNPRARVRAPEPAYRTPSEYFNTTTGVAATSRTSSATKR